MKTFKKSRLSTLSALLLLAACGGGGGEFSGNSDLPTHNSPDSILPIPGKTPVPGEGEGNPGVEDPRVGDPGGGNPGGGSGGGNPEEPKPIETAPWKPIRLLSPELPEDPAGETFNFLVFSDIHTGTSVRETMDFHPSSWTSDDNDLDPGHFVKFIDKIIDYYKNWLPSPNYFGTYTSHLALTADPWKETRKQEFVLLLGDISAHGGDREKNLGFAFGQLKRLGDALGNVGIVNVHGNNDSGEGWYKPSRLTNYFKVPQAHNVNWKHSYLSNGIKCSLTATYPCINSAPVYEYVATRTSEKEACRAGGGYDAQGICRVGHGYFSVNLRKKLKLISFESVMFHDSARGNYGASAAHEELKKTQLFWLDQELRLSTAQGEAVIIAMHITPSTNAEWAYADVQRFENVIKQNNSNIIGFFTGHSHFDNTYKHTIGKSFPRINVVGLSTSHANALGFREIAMVKKNGNWAIKDSRTITVVPTKYPAAPLRPADPNNERIRPPAPLEFELQNLYSFNEAYCPTKNQSGTLTMLECLNKIENRDYSKYETAGNPNCVEYNNGKCYSTKELSAQIEAVPLEKS